MNEATDIAAEFLNWASQITGLEKAKRNPAVIASVRLKKLRDCELWEPGSSSYLSFMKDILAKCDDVKNIIHESAADERAKVHATKLCEKLSEVANGKVERKPIIAIRRHGFLSDNPTTKADFGNACDVLHKELSGTCRQHIKKCEQFQ